jgi:hypothetical protein
MIIENFAQKLEETEIIYRDGKPFAVFLEIDFYKHLSHIQVIFLRNFMFVLALCQENILTLLYNLDTTSSAEFIYIIY